MALSDKHIIKIGRVVFKLLFLFILNEIIEFNNKSRTGSQGQSIHNSTAIIQFYTWDNTLTAIYKNLCNILFNSGEE